MAAHTYILRKLWGGVRALWRNSPHASWDERIQALKDLMRRTEGDVARLHTRAMRAVASKERVVWFLDDVSWA